MPAITRSRRPRNVRARAATVGTAALVMTALEACGSDDDSTDAASAPSFTSGSAASPEAAAGNDTDDEAVDAAGNATVNGDESRVQNFGFDSLAITGDNNTVVGGPAGGAPVSDTGTGNTVI
ncbi:hypothetical protein [Corynebacterium variabile]|uniref:hypothetical protein n=1 Tax=Corynebacterium variabile TaxID=1727 RepID=UPI00289B433A|nr:hypothetical protein [Corynebacterium variabile]